MLFLTKLNMPYLKKWNPLGSVAHVLLEHLGMWKEKKSIHPSKRNEQKFKFSYVFLCLEKWEGNRIKISSNVFFEWTVSMRKRYKEL